MAFEKLLDHPETDPNYLTVDFNRFLTSLVLVFSNHAMNLCFNYFFVLVDLNHTQKIWKQFVFYGTIFICKN